MALAALLLAGHAPPVRGEPAAPALAEPAAPPLLQLPAGWGSLQQTLQLPAWIDLDLEVLAEPMANPVGGTRTAATWIQQSTLALTLSNDGGRPPEQWREQDRWTLQLAVAAYNGSPDLAESIGAAIPLQQVTNPVGLWLTRASVKRRAENSRWGLEAGVLTMNPDLFTAPIASFYVHDALNGAPVLFPIPSFPLFPVAAPGARLVLKPTPATTLQLASFDLAAADTFAGLLGAETGLPPGRGWTHQAQWSYAPPWLNRHLDEPLPACREPRGIGRRRSGCREPVRVERQLPGGLLQLAAYTGTGPNRGVYGSATLPLSLPWGLDHRLWATAAHGFDDAANPTPSYLGGGLVSQGVLPWRPFDLLILGVARTGFSPVTSPGRSYEGVVELGYQLRISQSLNLQPSLQWILNPGGGGGVPAILAAGLQLDMSF